MDKLKSDYPIEVSILPYPIDEQLIECNCYLYSHSALLDLRLKLLN